MEEIYAYTYPGHLAEGRLALFEQSKPLVAIKVGDTTQGVVVRMAQQGGTAEAKEKIPVCNFQFISTPTFKRDHDLHRLFKRDGRCSADLDGDGTEWFYFEYIQDDATTIDSVKKQIAQYMEELQTNSSLKFWCPDPYQQRKLDQAVAFVDECLLNSRSIDLIKIIEAFCPRFGKTGWILCFVAELRKRYQYKYFVLPAYMLSSHSSFIDHINDFRNFKEIFSILESKDPCFEQKRLDLIQKNFCVVILVSLHVENTTELDHIHMLPSREKIIFIDEGDFGAHTDTSVERINYLIGDITSDTQKPIVSMGSGTNIQRMVTGMKKIAPGAISKELTLIGTYSQKEQLVPGTIQRSWYRLGLPQKDKLIKDAAAAATNGVFSWARVWADPWKHQKLIKLIVESCWGLNIDRAGMAWNRLNLSSILRRQCRVVKLYTSADIDEMNIVGQIAKNALRDKILVKVLNSEHTSNRQAEAETKSLIKEAKLQGFEGVLVISNSMGARSWSVSQVDVTVLAFDRGNVDAVDQKASRVLTAGQLWDGSPKHQGVIISLSVDPNRDDRAVRLFLNEARNVSKECNVSLPTALRSVIPSYNIFECDEAGSYVAVDPSDLMIDVQDTDVLMKLANVSFDIDKIVSSESLMAIMHKIVPSPKVTKKEEVLLDRVSTYLNTRKRCTTPSPEDTQFQRLIEKIINEAISTINQSATSIFLLAGADNETFRACVDAIISNSAAEFSELWGIQPTDLLTLLNNDCLPSEYLDLIVTNSKHQLLTHGKDWMIS